MREHSNFVTKEEGVQKRPAQNSEQQGGFGASKLANISYVYHDHVKYGVQLFVLWQNYPEIME